MVTYRLEKMNEILKQTIAEILHRSIKDPRIGFVTVTMVHTARDQKSAKVFISQIGSQEEKQHSIEALQHAAPFIQRETGHLLRLKYTPKLDFVIDHNPDYAQKIISLLEHIADEHE